MSLKSRIVSIFISLDIQYQIILILLLMIMILTFYYRTKRWLYKHVLKYDKTEGFISQPNAIDELDNRRSMWPVNDRTGLRPIVLKNTNSYPEINIAYITGSGINKNAIGPILEIMRNRIYPFIPSIGMVTDADVINYVVSEKKPIVRFGVVRENVLLETQLQNNTTNNQKQVDMWYTWCPMYHEVMLALGPKYGFLTNMQQLRDLRPDGTPYNVAVLKADLPYFQLVCRNLNVPWSMDTRRFNLEELNMGTVSVKEAMNKITDGSLDMIFMLTHPKNKLIQDQVISTPTRLINIYPPNAIPDMASQNTPYDPEEPTADLRLKFTRDMRRDIPWIFSELMDRTRIPLISTETPEQSDEENKPESPIYYTFRIRSLLISNIYEININNGKEYGKALKNIGYNLVKYYQTMNETLMQWNSINASQLSKQIGHKIQFNPDDRNSFDFAAISAIPKELSISPAFKSVLLENKLIKNEIIYSCKL